MSRSVSRSSTPRTSRLNLDEDAAQRIFRRLTPRDRRLLHLLADHRVLTTTQIQRMAFDGLVTTQHRLAILRKLGLIDSYMPMLRGDGGHERANHVLDANGAYVVHVIDRDHDPRTVPWTKHAATAAVFSQRREHLRGVNGIFAGMLGHARRTEGCALPLWWSEQRFTAWYDETTRRNIQSQFYGSPWAECRPDSYAVWAEHGAEIPFALEYDRGTETLDRLRGKLVGYTDLAWLFRQPIWLLLTVPGPRREANAHALLDGARLPIATATCHDADRFEAWQPVWQPLGTQLRLRLGDLARRPWPDTCGEMVRLLADPEIVQADRRIRDLVHYNRTPPDPCDPDRERHRQWIRNYGWLDGDPGDGRAHADG